MTKIGHEFFNLEPNRIDGRYYGYCPPYGRLNITRLGANRKDEFVDNVLVIYTKKVRGSSSREVIAFTDNARVFRQVITNPELERNILQEGKIVDCSYGIVSDNLYDLKEYPEKFIIHSSKYSRSLFRGQRVYKGSYPDLDKKVIAFLERYLDAISDEDSLVFQRRVQEESVSSTESSSNTWSLQPQYVLAGGSKAVSKNAHTSKLSLLHSGFKCAIDHSHSTFQTARGVQYMEGHHLIPCTYQNATRFWDERKRNIDCEEIIVCLCPTCHRQVHFGSTEEKKAILKVLHKKQIMKLKSVGLGITFEELINLY